MPTRSYIYMKLTSSVYPPVQFGFNYYHPFSVLGYYSVCKHFWQLYYFAFFLLKCFETFYMFLKQNSMMLIIAASMV